MNIRKIIISAVFSIMVLSTCAYAKTMEFTIGDTNVSIREGEISSIQSEVAPYTINDRTMVPVRIVSETFGANVNWDEALQKVTITDGEKVISLVLGSNIANINGDDAVMDVAPVETNGRTLVPLRFISEYLGYNVKYVEATEQVIVTDSPVVMIVGGTDVTLNELSLIYNKYKSIYNSSFSDEEYLEQALYDVKNYVLLSDIAKKAGVTFNADSLDSIKESAKVNHEQQPAFGLVSEYAYAISLMELANDYQYYIGAMVKEPTDEEIIKEYNDNYMAAKHILIESSTENAENLIKSIKLKVARDKDSFDLLMKEYTEDPGLSSFPDGYVFTSGEMIEVFENAVKNLKPGEISDIVQSEYGYHIIKRIDLPEISESGKSDVAENLAYKRYIEEINSIVENTDVEIYYNEEELLELFN
ncbi:MAG: peptidylprolyl isomerase [Clostridia bacterium]|nr:peptidylprolyl isomerase [Clostridia bacterium]